MAAKEQTRGRGRPPLAEGEGSVTLNIRLTPAQRDKLQRLGGVQRLREWLDRAKEPATK